MLVIAMLPPTRFAADSRCRHFAIAMILLTLYCFAAAATCYAMPCFAAIRLRYADYFRCRWYWCCFRHCFRFSPFRFELFRRCFLSMPSPLITLLLYAITLSSMPLLLPLYAIDYFHWCWCHTTPLRHFFRWLRRCYFSPSLLIIIAFAAAFAFAFADDAFSPLFTLLIRHFLCHFHAELPLTLLMLSFRHTPLPLLMPHYAYVATLIAACRACCHWCWLPCLPPLIFAMPLWYCRWCWCHCLRYWCRHDIFAMPAFFHFFFQLSLDFLSYCWCRCHADFRHSFSLPPPAAAAIDITPPFFAIDFRCWYFRFLSFFSPLSFHIIYCTFFDAITDWCFAIRWYFRHYCATIVAVSIFHWCHFSLFAAASYFLPPLIFLLRHCWLIISITPCLLPRDTLSPCCHWLSLFALFSFFRRRFLLRAAMLLFAFVYADDMFSCRCLPPWYADAFFSLSLLFFARDYADAWLFDFHYALSRFRLFSMLAAVFDASLSFDLGGCFRWFHIAVTMIYAPL